jgi:hypothetical protein
MYKIYREPTTTRSSGLFEGKCGIILGTAKSRIFALSQPLASCFVAVMINKIVLQRLLI